jgi:hypothetical protein
MTHTLKTIHNTKITIITQNYKHVIRTLAVVFVFKSLMPNCSDRVTFVYRFANCLTRSIVLVASWMTIRWSPCVV